jgi:predicted TPR repeat methyltransferase
VPDRESERFDAVARARSLAGVEEAARLYADWSATYDADVFERLAFIGSARIAELLAGALPDLEQPVIDLGCGTGAVGRRLAELRVATVDGIDLSPEMLAIAASTGAYRRLSVGDLNALPGNVDMTYGASVSAGTFTTGHVGPDAVPALMRLLRPDGLVAWVIAASVWPRFEPVLATIGLDVLHQAVEPIRRDGPPEAVMFVARFHGAGDAGVV